MSRSQAGIYTPNPSRILKPEALSKFRPLTLTAACRTLSIDPRRIEALKLIKQYFPQEMPAVLARRSWLDVLKHFLTLVDQTWFEIDWETINKVEQWAYHDYPEEEEEEVENPDWESPAMDILARALTAIPFRCQGFDQEALFSTPIGTSFILELIKKKCKPNPVRPLAKDSDDLLPKNVWLYAELTDWTTLSTPVRWLPEVVTYVCSQTSNPILDNIGDFDNWIRPDWYDWDVRDMTLIQDYSQAAVPVMNRITQFVAWADNYPGAAAEVSTLLDLPYVHDLSSL